MAPESLDFYTLDVFTTTDSPASCRIQQKLANGFNLSETVILFPPNRDDRSKQYVRIYTPGEELPFAGHPTIGSLCFWAAQNEELSQGTLVTKAGPILFKIERRGSHITARAAVPFNVHEHRTHLDQEQLRPMQPSLARYNNLCPASGWPLVSITKGMTFALIRVASKEELSHLAKTAYKSNVQMDDGWSPSFVGYYYYHVAFERDSGALVHLNTRMIEPEVGEDPVTGSTACALVTYLAREAYHVSATRKSVYRITQGEHMGRPGSLTVEVTGTPLGLIEEIMLCGTAVAVMKGKIDIG